MKELTNEEAEHLLHIPKFIIINDEARLNFTLSFKDKIYGRYDIRSDDGNNIFLMQISQSKLNIKISLYFQENARPVGLLRVDYNASDHKNPALANEYVPNYIKPYTNKHISGSHIHVYVQGYKPLAWAIPIGISDFSAKELSNMEDFDYAVTSFCDTIGLKTKIQCERRLFL